MRSEGHLRRPGLRTRRVTVRATRRETFGMMGRRMRAEGDDGR